MFFSSTKSNPRVSRASQFAWSYNKTQTQRHVHVGATLLTLTSLRSELLHDTSLEAYERRNHVTNSNFTVKVKVKIVFRNRKYLQFNKKSCLTNNTLHIFSNFARSYYMVQTQRHTYLGPPQPSHSGFTPQQALLVMV